MFSFPTRRISFHGTYFFQQKLEESKPAYLLLLLSFLLSLLLFLLALLLLLILHFFLVIGTLLLLGSFAVAGLVVGGLLVTLLILNQIMFLEREFNVEEHTPLVNSLAFLKDEIYLLISDLFIWIEFGGMFYRTCSSFSQSHSSSGFCSGIDRLPRRIVE